VRVTGFICVSWMLVMAGSAAATGLPPKEGEVTIRIEKYPRPPYSEATYFIYERDGQTICTKLAVCDKFDACDTEYHAGSYKADLDASTGDPYHATPKALIAPEKLRKHMCLTKFVHGLP
jgi:hypothetical protein